MNIKWTVLETDVTPKSLRLFADKLDKEMSEANIGDEVPTIELKDWESKTIIVLRANQEAYHNRTKGQWT